MANFIPFSLQGTAVMAAKLNNAGGVDQTGYIRSSDMFSSQATSGSWNPTPTAVSPSNPSVLIISGNYSRVGDVVTCSLFMDVAMGPGEVIAIFDLDLPIPSNFEQSKNAFGIIAFTGDTGSISSELINWGIGADVATNKIVINMQSTSADFNYQYVIAMLQYVVI
jgi:hypothetical protein